MSALDLLTMGESSRIDYLVREHEKLQRHVQALTTFLIQRNIVTADDIAQLVAAEAPAEK